MESKRDGREDLLPQLLRHMAFGLNSLARDLGNDNCIVYGIAQEGPEFTFCQMRLPTPEERKAKKSMVSFL